MRKLFVFLLVGLLLLSFSVGVLANYPNRPVRMIVPWAAGGDTDVLMRLVAQYSEKYLGQPMVVVNVTGASGAIGAREVMSARPDGYTILASNDSIGMSYVSGLAEFNYFDFEPIALVTSTPMVVATQADQPWETFSDVLAAAAQKPGEIRFGVTLGSTTQLLPSAAAVRANAPFRIVGYDGTAPRMTALLGKHIDLGETSLPAGIDYVTSGDLRLLAITSGTRHSSLPDLPTLREQGLDFEFAANRGFVAPKGTPQEIIKKLEDVFRQVAQDPEFIQRVEVLGTDVLFLDAQGYGKYLEGVLEEYGELVEALF
jgi:tripartite-type tricarboxylate transporter receptor subunit TctC